MKIVLDKIQQYNLKLILDKSYGLDGFMNEKEYKLVLNNNTLDNGIQFPVPIVLQIEEDKYEELKEMKEVVLCDEYNTHLANMIISDFYKPDIEKEYKFYTEKFRNYFYYFGDNYYHIGGRVSSICNTLDYKTKFEKLYDKPTINKPDDLVVFTYPYDTDSTKYKKYNEINDNKKPNTYCINFPYTGEDLIKEKLERLKEIVLNNYGYENKHLNIDHGNISSNKNKGCCLWFIGLSASGKTTLSNAVKSRLLEMNPNRKIVHIDGDKNVNIIFKQYSISNQVKTKNRNWGALLSSYRTSEILKDSDIIVIITTTTPFYKPRLYNRWLIEKYGKYLEILMDTPIDICKKRDPKKLYKRVEEGEIKNFVGIYQPFEKNDISDIIINDFNMEENIDKIIDYID